LQTKWQIVDISFLDKLLISLFWMLFDDKELFTQYAVDFMRK